MEKEMQELINWLSIYRPKQNAYKVNSMRKYYRIACKDGSSAFCFVVKEDCETKNLGKMKKGDLMCPSTWSAPAKHARGQLFDKTTWDSTFTDYGMRMLRN